MGKVGVNKPHWDSSVNSAIGAIDSLSTVKVKSLGKTNLNRFKDWHTLQERLNQTLTKFKGYAQADTKKMKAAGERFKSEDGRVAKQFKEVRFK
ncbi:TIGR04197 family type VII secretion effector [Lacticaseibacillus pantheris]|uniref:TIGR04197 family type VII secretion effector n=1 Tax=Lacticaseibacillus pantheris TaxID=171523 RepID=UPI00265826F7|nr:TIGR04197 family type VII secretion effector [Lacticaseibacillus pantheris]WKF84414.1 TIGR04197 family type VII secretion effector [Lacticaseibacillus pantheris]